MFSKNNKWQNSSIKKQKWFNNFKANYFQSKICLNSFLHSIQVN